MRKLLYNFLFGLLCALALFMLSACNGKTESVPNSNAESNQAYSGQFIYLTENTNKNLISIPIPLNDSFNQKTITFIEEFIENEIFIFSGENFDLKLSENNITDTEKEYSDYCIIMESKKLYNSGDIISMVFDDIFNKKSAAHPVHWFFSLNFNPKTLEIISFSENYHIDKDLQIDL